MSNQLKRLIVISALLIAPFQNGVVQAQQEELATPKIEVRLSLVVIPDPIDANILLLQARITGQIPQDPQGVVHFEVAGVPLAGCESMPVAYILAYYQASCSIQVSGAPTHIDIEYTEAPNVGDVSISQPVAY